MLETGGDLRLAQEALAEAGLPGELGRHDLQRNVAPQMHLLGPVDRTHAALTDDLIDPVASQLHRNARTRAPGHNEIFSLIWEIGKHLMADMPRGPFAATPRELQK